VAAQKKKHQWVTSKKGGREPKSGENGLGTSKRGGGTIKKHKARKPLWGGGENGTER